MAGDGAQPDAASAVRRNLASLRLAEIPTLCLDEFERYIGTIIEDVRSMFLGDY